jgi:hypothetical protein
MEVIIQQIVRQSWSVDPAARGPFKYILEGLGRIRFKTNPAVDVSKVSEFVALINPSAAAKPVKHRPPLVNKEKLLTSKDGGTGKKKWKDPLGREYGRPDGIIAHMTSECGGNVHESHVIDVTCGSFEEETEGAKSYSEAFNNSPK